MTKKRGAEKKEIAQEKTAQRFAASNTNTDFQHIDPTLLAEAFTLAMEKANTGNRKDIDATALAEALSITMKNHRKDYKEEAIKDWNLSQKGRMRDQLIVLIGLLLIVIDWFAFSGKIFTNIILLGGLVALGYAYWRFRKGTLPHQIAEQNQKEDTA
ncbi:MAG: hypothetical protein ACTSXQ_04235 [Alphaproteobacteria bacterium]